MADPRHEIQVRTNKGSWVCLEMFESKENAERYFNKLQAETPTVKRRLITIK